MLQLAFYTCLALAATFLYNKSDDIAHALRQLQETRRRKNLFDILTGQSLSLDNTRVTWGWEGTPTVGRAFSFQVAVSYS